MNTPMIMYSAVTIYIITSKKDFFKKKIEKVYPNSPNLKDLEQQILVDYNIYGDNMLHSKEIQRDNYELNILINIIIAIYLTISIPLVYNKIYTGNVTVDINKSLQKHAMQREK